MLAPAMIRVLTGRKKARMAEAFASSNRSVADRLLTGEAMQIFLHSDTNHIKSDFIFIVI
ncbi:hypothetical protein PPUJ20005_41960 [Pseudomonas putida]|nr:hypothetical protein PPUJ20005_41960 [Pseudomonas putida]